MNCLEASTQKRDNFLWNAAVECFSKPSNPIAAGYEIS